MNVIPQLFIEAQNNSDTALLRSMKQIYVIPFFLQAFQFSRKLNIREWVP
jgi:hypothetical protein